MIDINYKIVVSTANISKALGNLLPVENDNIKIIPTSKIDYQTHLNKNVLENMSGMVHMFGMRNMSLGWNVIIII